MNNNNAVKYLVKSVQDIVKQSIEQGKVYPDADIQVYHNLSLNFEWKFTTQYQPVAVVIDPVNREVELGLIYLSSTCAAFWSWLLLFAFFIAERETDINASNRSILTLYQYDPSWMKTPDRFIKEMSTYSTMGRLYKII